MRLFLFFLLFFSSLFAQATNQALSKSVYAYNEGAQKSFLTDGTTSGNSLSINATETLVIDLGSKIDITKIVIPGTQNSLWNSSIMYNSKDDNSICTSFSDPDFNCYGPSTSSFDLEIATLYNNNDTSTDFIDFTLEQNTITTRYIAIEISSAGSDINISEIEIWGNVNSSSSDNNNSNDNSSSPEKTATSNITNDTNPVSNIIDEDNNTKFCSLRDNGDEVWFQVDLGAQFDLDSITLNNYSVDGLDNDLRNRVLELQVSSEGFDDTKKRYTTFNLPSTFDANSTVNINTKARYVRLKYDYNGSSREFCIGELTHSGTQSSNQTANVALGKTATLSSTKEPDFAEIPEANLSTDGNTSNEASTKSYSNQDTSKNWYENKLWLDIDLGADYTIDKLEIFKGSSSSTVNSINSNEDIFAYSKVYISSTPFSTNPSGDASFDIGNMNDINSKELSINKTLRYIRVQSNLEKEHVDFDNANINLNIAEIKAFGKINSYQLPENTVNAAFNASASQSTTTLPASNALDPSTNGSSTTWNDTTKDKNPWFIVDLGAEYKISQLKFDMELKTYYDYEGEAAYNRGDTNVFDSPSGTYEVLFSRVPFDTNPKGSEVIGKYDPNLVRSNRDGGKISFPDTFIAASVVSQNGETYSDTYADYDINTVARYIKIRVELAQSALKVSNFRALGVKQDYQLPDGSINASYGKTASEGSTFSVNAYSGAASKCIDGDFNSSDSTCATNSGVSDNWWELDLGAFYDISQIKIYDKIGSPVSEGLNGAVIKISPISFNSATTNDIFEIDMDSLTKIDTNHDVNTNRYFYDKIWLENVNKKARFIRIDKKSDTDGSELGFSEIKLFAKKSESQILEGYDDIATSSNIYPSSLESWSNISFANDSNNDTRVITQALNKSFIEIDLKDYYDIFNIELYELTKQYLVGATIKISNLPFNLNENGDFQYTISSVDSTKVNIDTQNQIGRYIRIEQTGSKPVAFDDIKIHAKKVTKPTNLSYSEPSSNATQAYDNTYKNRFDMDLGAEYDLKSLQILANLNDLASLHNADVILSRTPIDYTPNGELKINLGTLLGTKVSLDLNISARYIRVIGAKETLSFKDLTVYSTGLTSNPFKNGTTDTARYSNTEDKGDYWFIDLKSQQNLSEITLYNNGVKLNSGIVKISRIPFDTNPYGDTQKNINTRFDEVKGRYLAVDKSLGQNISFKAFGTDCNCDYYSSGSVEQGNEFIENIYENLENAAFKKGIKQSSGIDSYKLLDGNSSSFSSTNHENNPWFEIDLQDYNEIKYIELFAKDLNSITELKNIKVQFSSHSFDTNPSDIEELNLSDNTFDKSTISKFIAGDSTGLSNKSIRYIRVTKTTNSSFNLSQIQVLAKKSTKPNTINSNIAFNKTVSASQTINNSSNLTDNKKDTSITLSNATDPYVIIDLGGIYDINTLELVRNISWDNIANINHSEYLNNSTIYFSKTPFPENPLGDSSFNATANLYNSNSEYKLNASARYVKFMLHGNNRELSLSDIKVRGKLSADQQFADLFNASYLKTVTLSDEDPNDTAKYLTDGISDDFNKLTTVKNQGSKTTYLEIDLGKLVDIAKIEIFSQDANKIQGIEVKTSMVPFETNPNGDNPKYFDSFSNDGKIGTINYEDRLKARYVKIIRHDDKDLVISEVKVYASVSDISFEEGTTNVAFKKEVSANSFINNLEAITDGDFKSITSNDQWIEIDLGAEYDLKYITWKGSSVVDSNTSPTLELSQLPISTFKYNIEKLNLLDAKEYYQRREHMNAKLNTTARYVRINNNSGIVNEVLVYGKLSSNQELNDFENLAYNLKPYKKSNLVYSDNAHVNDWYIPLGETNAYITYDLGKQALIKFIELDGIVTRYAQADDLEILISKVPFKTNPYGDFKISLKGKLDSESLKENINKIISELNHEGRYVQIRVTNNKGGFHIDDVSIIAKPIKNTFQFDENSENATYLKSINGKYHDNTSVSSEDLKIFNDGLLEKSSGTPAYIQIDLEGYYDLKNIEIFANKENLKVLKILASASQKAFSATAENQIYTLDYSDEEFDKLYKDDRLKLDVDFKMVRYLILISSVKEIKEFKAFGNKSKIQMPLDTKDIGRNGDLNIYFDKIRDLRRIDLFNYEAQDNPNETPKLLIYGSNQTDKNKTHEIKLSNDKTQYIYINNTASRVELVGDIKGSPTMRVHTGEPKEFIENVALNKKASQSSNFGTAHASNAIDGNSTSFTYTKNERLPWLEIDLEKVYFLKELNIEFPFAIDKKQGSNENAFSYKLYTSTIPFSKKPQGEKDFEIKYLDASNKAKVELNQNARYIKIVLVGTKNLSIEEVQISAYETSTLNKALHKETTQTSTVDNHNSNLAVDGISIKDDTNEFTSIVKSGNFEYWQVDLGKLVDVHSVELIAGSKYGFGDTNVYLSARKVTESSVFYKKELSYYNTATNSDGNIYAKFTPNTTTRYILVEKNSNLAISEIKVYGEDYDETRYVLPQYEELNDTSGDDSSNNNDDTSSGNGDTNTGGNDSSNTTPKPADPSSISSGELVKYIKDRIGDTADLIPGWIWNILEEFSITIENPKFSSDSTLYFKVTGNILLDNLGKHSSDNLFVKIFQSSFKAVGKLFDFDGDGKVPIEIALKSPVGNNGELDFYMGLTLADSWQETGKIPPLDGNMAFKSFTMTGHAKGSATAFIGGPTISIESVGEFFLKPSAIDDWMQAKITIEPEVSLSGDIDIVIGAEVSGACIQITKGEAIDASKHCSNKDWDIFKLGMVQAGGGQIKITFAPDNASTAGIAAMEGYILGGKIGSHGSKITTSFRGEMINLKKLTPDEITSVAMNGTGLYLYADKVNMDTYFNNILPLPDIEPIKTVRDGLGTALSIFGGFEDLEVYMSPSIGGFSVGNVAAYLKKEGSTYPSDRKLPNLSESGAAFRTDLDILGIKSTMHASLETNYLENGVSALSHVFSDPVKLISDVTSVKITYGFGGEINFDDFNGAIQKGAGSVPLLGPILEEVVSSFVFHEAKLELTFTQALVPDVGGGASLWFTIFGEDIKPKVDFGVLFSPFKFIIDFIVDKVGDLGKIIIEGIAEAGKAIAKGVEDLYNSVGEIVDGAIVAVEHLMDGAVQVANVASQESQKVLDSASILLDKPSIENLAGLGVQLGESALKVAESVGATLGAFVSELFNSTGKAIACSPLNFIDKPSYCDKKKEMVKELNSYAVLNWDWHVNQYVAHASLYNKNYKFDHNNKRSWNDETWDNLRGASWFYYRDYIRLNPIILESDLISEKDLTKLSDTGKAFDYFKYWQNHDIVAQEVEKETKEKTEENSKESTETKKTEKVANMFTGALGSRDFSSQYYLYRYKGIKEAYKDLSFAGAIKHYSDYGHKEGRTATPVAPIRNDYLDICRGLDDTRGIIAGHWIRNDLACAIGDTQGNDLPKFAFEILRGLDIKPLAVGDQEEEGHSVIYTGGLINGTMQRSKVCMAHGIYGHTQKNDKRELVCVTSSESLNKKADFMKKAKSNKEFHYLQAKHYAWVTPDYIDLSGKIKISENVKAKDIALGNNTLWIYATQTIQNTTTHWIYTRDAGKFIATEIDGNIEKMGADEKGHLWIQMEDDSVFEYVLVNGEIKKATRNIGDVSYTVYDNKSNHTMNSDGNKIHYGLTYDEIRNYKGKKYNEYRGIQHGKTKEIFVENPFITFDIDTNSAIWTVGKDGVIYHDILAPTYLATSRLKGLATDRFNLNDLKDMQVSTLKELDDNAKLVSGQTGIELTFTTDTGGIFKVKPASKDKAITKVDILNALPPGVTAIKLFDTNISKARALIDTEMKISKETSSLTQEQQTQLDLLGYYEEDVYYDLGTGKYIKVTVKHYKQVDVPQDVQTVETKETSSFEETLSLTTIKEGWNAYGNSMQYNAINAKEIFNTNEIYTYVNGSWSKNGIVQPGQAFWVLGGEHNVNIDLSTLNGSTNITSSFKDETQWNFLVATKDTTVSELSEGSRKIWAFDKVNNNWVNDSSYSLNKGDVYWIGPKTTTIETKDERVSTETMELPELKTGWNLLGNSMSSSSILLDDVFENKIAYVYNAGEWKTTTKIEPGQAYWIELKESDLTVNKTIKGYSATQSDYKDLVQWNLLTTSKDIYIGDITTTKGKVWAYDNSTSTWYDNLDYQIKKGQGFFIEGLPMNIE